MRILFYLDVVKAVEAIGTITCYPKRTRSVSIAFDSSCATAGMEPRTLGIRVRRSANHAICCDLAGVHGFATVLIELTVFLKSTVVVGCLVVQAQINEKVQKVFHDEMVFQLDMVCFVVFHPPAPLHTSRCLVRAVLANSIARVMYESIYAFACAVRGLSRPRMFQDTCLMCMRSVDTLSADPGQCGLVPFHCFKRRYTKALGAF